MEVERMLDQAGSLKQGVETLTREAETSLQQLFPLLRWVMELYRLGQLGDDGEGYDGICHDVIAHVVEGFSASSGSLAMRDTTGDGYRLVAATALPRELLGGEVTPGQGILGEVLLSGTPRFLEGDLSHDPHMGPLTANRITKRPASAICWPLQGESGVVGALSINRDSAPPFTEHDLEWGQFLIDLIAIVLENLRLHLRSHDHIRQLESLNTEMSMMNQRLEQTQNQLLQSEKMAAIGQLAAGVAHEINNPVGYVYSNLGTLEHYLEDIYRVLDAYHALEQKIEGPRELLEPLRTLKSSVDLAYLREDIGSLVSESREGVERVKQIVQDLKEFSHVGQTDWQWADLHKGLDSTLNIVWNELKYKAEVKREYGELPQVECVPSQLNQVFMNLLVNAAQAIDTHGTITVRTQSGGEGWVKIDIIDTGKGIAKDNIHRVFEPFYTTKPVGKGTGLGLSLSYGIIATHHGRIEVESEVGKGTTFTILLPVAQPQFEVTSETELQ